MPLHNYIDDALSMVGYGRWQIPFFLLTFLCHILVAGTMVGTTLLSAPLSFRCFSSPAAPTGPTSHLNQTATISSLPFTDICGATEHNMSTLPPLLRQTDLPSCPFVEYDHSIFSSTIISEFDLVCERASLRPLFQVLVSAGVLFGSPVGGIISDKYGRKTVVFVGVLMTTAVMVVMAVSPWYWAVLLTRFLLGITQAFFFLPSFNLVQETTPPNFRSLTGMLAGLGFSVGVMALAGVALLVTAWRHLLLTLFSTLFVIIPLAWWVEESPRWLAQNGRQREAAEALQKAAHRNRVTVTPELVAVLHKLRGENRESDGVEEHGVKTEVSTVKGCLSQCQNYLRYPGLRRILLVEPVVMYMQTLMYMGIILNANNFTSNDPYVYVAMTGVMDFAALVLATPLTMRFGRSCLCTILFFISGSLLLLNIVIPAEYEWIKWIFVMTAFLLSAATFQIQLIYGQELFPTVIRSSGIGLVNGMGSLGLLTAPIITDLLVQKAWWAVNVACGVAGLLNSLLLTLLPETRNLPLPETVHDVEKRRLHNKGRKYTKTVEDRAADEVVNPLNTEHSLHVESTYLEVQS